ncbi:hypothetical protein L227DRAFT_465449, partial [Lentinus tigrinus ALCF2SS1-6]
QALMLANQTTFRNCLVVMRLTTRKSELPTRTTVRNRIEDKFNDFIDELKSDI